MSFDAKRDDRIVRLLTALVVMMALMIAGVGGGAAVAYHQAMKVQRALKGEAKQEAASAAEELTDRQEKLAIALEKRAEQSFRELQNLRQRRKALDKIPGGPIDKTNFAFQFIQLMSDQVFLLTNHLMITQEMTARALKPLPTQRELTGTGGSGSADSANRPAH